MDPNPESQRLSWTLVRTPLRRYSADEYVRTSIGDVTDDKMLTGSLSETIAVEETDTRRSMDDRDLDSGPATRDEVRLNPWTTYRRAPKTLRFSEVDDYQPPSENLKPRTKLDLSIISNFKPVGQLVTLRRVSPLPEDDYESANRSKAEHENTAFVNDIPTVTESSPVAANTVTEGKSAPIASKSVTESAEADQCSPGKHRHRKKGNNKLLDNQKEAKSSPVATKELITKIEKEVEQNAMKLQAGVHSCVTRQKKSKSETEQSEEKVKDSAKSKSNEGTGKAAPRSYFYCRMVTKYPKSSFCKYIHVY